MPRPETLPTTASLNYLELPPDAQEALYATTSGQPVATALSLHEQVTLAIARQDAEVQGNVSGTFAYETPPLPEHPTLRSRFATTRLGRLAAKAAMVTIGFLGGATAVATPAQAETTHTYTVTGTGGEGVWLHGDPGLGDTGDLIKLMPDGTRFTADCYVNDTPIGPRNNPVWLHGKDQTGATGYFTDYYSNSKWSRNDKSGLPPVCGENAPDLVQEAVPSESPADTIKSIPYNRTAAVTWARTHAKDTPPYDASCTWFVSNALWRGGLPEDMEWSDNGGHGHTNWRPGTVDAWEANHFVEYIRRTYPQSSYSEINFARNKVPKAELGDVIAYDWEDDGEIDHLSFVTDIVGAQYPEVAEWSPLPDGKLASPYTERGWTWSEASHKWIQEKTDYKAAAFLLHIDTTKTGTF